MKTLFDLSWKRSAVIGVTGLFAALLFVTMSFGATYASEEIVSTDSPAPVSTPVPPEVVTETVVVTETIVVTETVVVTETMEVTRVVELTGTVQGTTILPTTVVVTDTEVMTRSEVVTDTQIIFLDVGIIEGQIWHDLDNNGTGIVSVGDQSLAGVIVRLSSGNGIFREATTDADGFYLFENLPLNQSYSIQVDPESLPDNKKFRPNYDPDSVPNSITTVTLTGDAPVVAAQNFSYAAGDYGDLPDTYSTSAPNGAFHATVTDGSQLTLGIGLDVEAIANIDDNARGDSQDNGVALLSPRFVPGEKISFRIFTDGAIPANGASLGVWTDWNLDGMFSEDEFESYAIVGDENDIQVCVPEDYTDSPIPMRFRLFTNDQIPGGTLDWTDFQGPAVNGEVEDYIFALSTAVSLSNMELTTTPPTILLISLVVLTTATIGVNRSWSEQ